jgi:hypothetical protein
MLFGLSRRVAAGCYVMSFQDVIHVKVIVDETHKLNRLLLFKLVFSSRDKLNIIKFEFVLLTSIPVCFWKNR